MRRTSRQSAIEPRWITTFTDLTAIILCFFVLTFSMSSVDIQTWQAMQGHPGQTLDATPDVRATADPFRFDWRPAGLATGGSDAYMARVIEARIARSDPELEVVVDAYPRFLEVHVEGPPATIEEDGIVPAATRRTVRTLLASQNIDTEPRAVLIYRRDGEPLHESYDRTRAFRAFVASLRRDVLFVFKRLPDDANEGLLGIRLARNGR